MITTLRTGAIIIGGHIGPGDWVQEIHHDQSLILGGILETPGLQWVEGSVTGDAGLDGERKAAEFVDSATGERFAMDVLIAGRYSGLTAVKSDGLIVAVSADDTTEGG